MEDKLQKTKKNPADIVAATLLGLGLGIGFFPIALASIIVKQNLFLKIFNHMEDFWHSRGWK